MNVRHLSPRKPRPYRHSWTRVIPADQTGVIYRLFRRDLRGRMHMEELRYYRDAPRNAIAGDIRQARKRLLNKVDAIDFGLLGLDIAA